MAVSVSRTIEEALDPASFDQSVLPFMLREQIYKFGLQELKICIDFDAVNCSIHLVLPETDKSTIIEEAHRFEQRSTAKGVAFEPN